MRTLNLGGQMKRWVLWLLAFVAIAVMGARPWVSVYPLEYADGVAAGIAVSVCIQSIIFESVNEYMMMLCVVLSVLAALSGFLLNATLLILFCALHLVRKQSLPS